MSALLTFDPRLVPVLGDDHHLPAVGADRLQPDALRERLRHPPRWEPEMRRDPRFTDRSPALAAVLVPVVSHSRPTVLLTQRTAHLSTHSGQVAFPGGRVDPGDVDAVAAALREADEEVGLPADRIEVLGTMPEYVTGTAFTVTPVVALVQPGFVLKPNPSEVQDTFEVPLDWLMDPAHHRRHRMEQGGQVREWLSMPYDDAGRERFIWGATAAMLRNFYRLLSA